MTYEQALRCYADHLRNTPYEETPVYARIAIGNLLARRIPNIPDLVGPASVLQAHWDDLNGYARDLSVNAEHRSVIEAIKKILSHGKEIFLLGQPIC